MFKKLKILKKWYVSILILLVVISTFLGFILSYTESKKQSLMSNIQNYVRLSSYAVRGKILKDQEGINKDYVNKTLANKKITDEFGSSFIWKQDRSDTSSQDTISNLLQTYFGKSTDLFTDNIKYLDKKDKNKLKDINNTNSQNIIPENINNFIGVVNLAKKFISGLSSSTVNLGVNLLQRNFLRTTKEVEAIKNNNAIKTLVKYVETNQGLLSTIADILISSSDDQLEPNFYQNLTVRQLFNKHLNKISEVITNKKYFNHDQDNLANDLIQYFWQEIIDVFKKEFANNNEITAKIKNILKAIKEKFDFKKFLKKVLPSLIRYLKTELFFATYYVVNPKLTIAELLNQSIDAQQFKTLTSNRLDLGVLLKGLSLVFQNQNSGKRFLDFIFKKVDADKIYFTSKDQPVNIGTSNLLFDILNAIQSALLSTTSALSFVIPKIEDYIDKHKENIKKLITDNLTNLLKKYLPTSNKNFKWAEPEFENDKLKIDIQYWTVLWWNNIANGHINVFGNKGILSNLIKGFKDIIFTSSELLSTISNYIKHIFYKSENKNFDLDKAFSNLASLIRISNNLLETQYLDDKNKNEDNLVMFLGLGPKNLAKIYSIYDILNLPHAQIFQTPVIGDLIVKYAGKFLKPFETIYQELKKYKFISDTRQFRVQFPKYLKRTADFIENYAKKHSAIPKYDLIENLYTENKNFAVDFATKWSKFFVPDDKDNNNPLLPIVKAILRDPENSKNEKIKSLADVRQAIQDLGSKLVNNKAFFKNFKSLSEILIPISKLSTFLGLKELEDINLSTLLSQIGETILNHNKKYSDKLIDLDITALGYILKSLTIKITAKNNNVLVVNNKNILSTIFNSLDAADNKTKEATEIPKNSYFLWDSVELKLDNKSLSGEIKISKTDSSASPLSILLGIGNDKTKYLTGSILHSLSTLIGGLKANDALYKLSLENKNSLIYGIDAWEEILKDKQKQLAKKEYQQAGQYYQNNSWITKLISYNHNQIKYQLIRTHDSNNDHVKKIGKKFEVTLSKSTNNHAYWIISQVLALDYQQ